MKKQIQRSSLLEALAHTGLVSRDKGEPWQTHVSLADRWAVASDGTLSAGHPITEDLRLAAPASRLAAALGHAEPASISVQTGPRIAVRAGALSAALPCLDIADMPWQAPDSPCGLIGEPVRAALIAAGALSVEGSQDVLTASVLLRSGSAVASDRVTMLEYWHGTDLPTLAVPKEFVTAINKVKYAPTLFGFSDRSLTFYFQNKSWIKTKLFRSAWTEADKIERILCLETEPYDSLPEQFYEAVDAISAFCTKDPVVWLSTGFVSSAKKADEVKYEVPDLVCEQPIGLRIASLKAIKSHMEWFSIKQQFKFIGSGDKVRGTLAIVRG